MIASNAFGGPSSGWIGTMAGVPGDCDCTVYLIDRRTGRPHRVNGAAVGVRTRQPRATAAALLAGRDPSVWEARISPIGSEAFR